ncbi:MAG: hypothetical protein ACU836_15020 [Gammaproteobacteria bacterium]
MDKLLINHEQLLDATGCKTKESLEKVLRSQKVPFLYGQKGRIFTTLTAVDAALGINNIKQEGADIEFRR